VISVGSARGSVFAWNQINTTNKKICKTSRFRDRGTSKSTIADSDAFTLILDPETLERDREIY